MARNFLPVGIQVEHWGLELVRKAGGHHAAASEVRTDRFASRDMCLL